jgi:cytochrome c
MFRKNSVALALLAGSMIAGSTAGAYAAGDAKAGADVFKRCAVCHTADKGGGDGLGPDLFGVFGRKVASRPGFSYSAALKKSGLVWNEATLTKWVAGPARVVPGTKMSFAGLSSKKQQADVVAYLATLK